MDQAGVRGHLIPSRPSSRRVGFFLPGAAPRAPQRCSRPETDPGHISARAPQRFARGPKLTRVNFDSERTPLADRELAEATLHPTVWISRSAAPGTRTNWLAFAGRPLRHTL